MVISNGKVKMSRFREAVEAARKLIRIPSVESAPSTLAPFGKENREALDTALEIASKIGFNTFCGEGYYGYAEVGDSEKPLFGILGHLDVVPVTDGWKYPPFEGRIAEGCLWGRGAEDDKAPMMAAMFAVRELLDEGLEPKKRVRLIFGCNEESGWRCIEEYLKKEELPEWGFSPDADFPVIYAEKAVSHLRLKVPLPEGLKSFSAGTRVNIVPDHAECVTEAAFSYSRLPDGISALNAGFEAFGRSAHGSTPREGDNAACKLIAFLSEGLPSLKRFRAFEATDGSLLGLKTDDEIYGALTLNAGVFETVGDSLFVSVDFRHPAKITTESIIERLKEFFGGEVEVRGSHRPLYVPKEHPLVKALSEAYALVTGDNAEPVSVGGATYARAIPVAVAFGPVFPGEHSNIHQTDERISLENFEKMMKIYKYAIKKLCF